MKRILLALLSSLCIAGSTTALAASLEQIRSAGVMSVAVYKDFAPFADEGQGIDIDIARKLGEKLGVKVKFLPFEADDSMDDDLRNMVWKGSLLGYGPADLMMHVPVEPAFAHRNEQVAIFSAYFRDNLLIARNLRRIPELQHLDDLARVPVGVEGDSIGADILGSARPSGNYDVRHYTDVQQAFADLKGGKLAAVLSLGSQAQAAMGREQGFAVEGVPLPGRVPRSGWAFGLAVKADHADLAQALATAMGELEREGALDEIFAAHGVRRQRP